MEYIMKVQHLNYEPLFHQFDISLEKSKLISIAGTNNCGKTTLIKIIAGIIPTIDVVSFEKVMIDSILSSLYLELGVVLGEEEIPFLFDSVDHELSFSLENMAVAPKIMNERIMEVAHFWNLEKLLKKNPHDLNLFEKRKLSIALAMMHKPKVLLLDSIFLFLSSDEEKFILSKLQELVSKEQMTIIYTTEQLDETLLADYLFIMDKGHIVIEGVPIDVLCEERILRRLGLALPFMIDLSLQLQSYHLVDDIITDMDRMVDAIWKSN